MAKVFLGIGSNLGDRIGYINRAIDNLRNVPGVAIGRVSSIIETEPYEAPGQGKYLNAVLMVNTDLEALELLRKLQDIEKNLGRERSFRNASRTIDLDILLYGENKIDEPGLTVPHPRMLERAFVTGPLLEIEPEFMEIIKKLKKEDGKG